MCTLSHKCTKECGENKVLRDKLDSMEEQFRTELEAVIAEKDTVIQSERTKIAEYDGKLRLASRRKRRRNSKRPNSYPKSHR